MIKNFILRNKSIINYIIFGVITTLINIIAYVLLYEFLNVPNAISNVIAWILAIIFAFITNKLYVFGSKDKSGTTMAREITLFVLARLATGAMDLLIMYIAVDILCQNAILFKIISNVIVIIANYVFSKLLVFKKS